MRFDIRNTAAKNDVPVMWARSSLIRSQDIVLGYDLAAQIPGNNIPAIGFIRSEAQRRGAVTELTYRSPFGKVHVTDEYVYDEETKTETPLWFKHVLRNRVYNKTLEGDQYIETGVNGLAEIPNITSGEKIIVYRSEDIFVIDGTGNRVPNTNYYLDYGRKSVITRVYSTSSILIEFKTLVSDLKVAQKDRSRYKVMYEQTAEDEFVCSILTESESPLVVTYFKKRITGESIEVVERTNPVPIYREIPVDYINDADNNNKKVFGIIPSEHNDFRVLVSPNLMNEDIYKTFSYRSAENTYTRLYMTGPYNAIYQAPWNASINGNGYVYTDSEAGTTLTFMPYEIERKRPIIRITETAEYVDRNTLRLSRSPVWEVGHDGEILGIDLIEEDSGNSLEITDIETANRLIRIRNTIGMDNHVVAEYRTRASTAAVLNNLNPVLDPSSYNYYHMYYIIPREHLVEEAGKSVFVYRLPRFSDSQKLIYNTRDFLQYFDLNRDYILEEIKEYLSVPVASVAAYMVGVFYLETPVDEDFMEIYESRVRGGGFDVETEHCGDWSRWDGEALDISGRLLIQIKKSIKQALKDRYLQWDERVIRSQSPSLKAEELTMEHIRRVIQKHIRRGYHYELEFIDG